MGTIIVHADRSKLPIEIQLIERGRVTEEKIILNQLTPATVGYTYKKSSAKLADFILKPLADLSFGGLVESIHPDNSTWLLADIDGEWCNWSGFMARKENQTQSKNRVSKIEYMPVVNASPTDWSTVHMTLKLFLDKSNGAPVLVVTFEYQLFLKAFEIVSKMDYPIMLRVGAFHHAKSYLGSMGKVMAGSGLEVAVKLVFEGDGKVGLYNER